MIEELHIRGLGVIEEASLRLAPGLTVITGETGAGKTMLVTALQLLLGERSDAGLVRHGSGGALVEAVIDPPPVAACDWHADGEPLLVAREIPPDGRSRARVGGRLAPVSALADVLGASVEVHAQHEHVRLGRADVQRALLDRYAGEEHATLLGEYAEAYHEWRGLRERRERLSDDARERARMLDRLRDEVDEIDAAEIDPERDSQLDEELEILGHVDAVRDAAAQATHALAGDGVVEALGHAREALRRAPVSDAALDELRGRLESIVTETSELSSDLRAYADGIDADPERLASLQERKRLLAGLQRRYGVDPAAVLAYADDARAQIIDLEAQDADAGALDDAVARIEEQLDVLAERVRQRRREAAAGLEEDVGTHLCDLGMPHARLHVEIDALGAGERTESGADRVAYLLAANPGEPPRPLGRAASGGERSRVSLAIEVALADVDEADVLVFDEVDAGIGGATAMSVGEKLARLTTAAGDRRRQVLCVTHLAQIAAFADVHHVVEKEVVDGRTVTRARQVAEDDRVGELARMMGGDRDAPAGRVHAEALLRDARVRRRR